MEDLLSHFTILSNQALSDKNFDPSAIDDLLKLFDIEAYNAWAASELHCENEAQQAHDSLVEAEEHLESAMESAMEEFRRFEEEMNRAAESEYNSLVGTAETARRMGNSMEKAAAVESKKYIEAAMNRATASMKSAWKGISARKVHPS